MRSDHVYLKDSCIVHQPNYAAVLHRLVDSWRMDVRKEISGKNGSIFKLVFGAFITAAHSRELPTRARAVPGAIEASLFVKSFISKVIDKAWSHCLWFVGQT